MMWRDFLWRYLLLGLAYTARVPGKLCGSVTRPCVCFFLSVFFCLPEHETLRYSARVQYLSPSLAVSLGFFRRYFKTHEIILTKRKLHLMTKRYKEAETTIAELEAEALKLRQGEKKNEAELGGWHCVRLFGKDVRCCDRISGGEFNQSGCVSLCGKSDW